MEEEGPNAFGRGEGIQNLERFGTGLLGIGIIAMLISVPVLSLILLLYIFVEFGL